MHQTGQSDTNRRSRRALLVLSLLATVLVVGVGGCKRTAAPAAAAEDKLVVFAATSLRDVFTALGADFKRTHPGVELTFNFAGTQELRTQIEHGAAVDVFASADQRHMDELLRATRVKAPVVFARNEPVIVVTKEAAPSVHGLGDLPSLARLVVGTPEVPIGRYTLQILDRASTTLGSDFRARVEAKVVSRELNVRQVLLKVSLGEAQAGIVYRTDTQAVQGKAAAQSNAATQDKVSVVTIPADLNVIASYPIALVTGTQSPGLARAWVDFVLSSAGQTTLSQAGFLPP